MRIAVAVLAVALAAPGGAWGIGKETLKRADDFEVTINSQWCGNASGGYYPIRARIVNKGAERTVTLRFVGKGEPLPRVQRTIRVGQNATSQVTLSVPCVSRGTYGEFQVLHEGRVLTGLSDTVSLPDPHTNGQPRPALLVISPTTVDCDQFEAGATGLIALGIGAGYGYSSGASSDHEVVRPGMLPPSWIDYSGVDLVAVSLATLESLGSDERQAIMNWVHTGGTLIVYSVDAAPAESEGLAKALSLDRHAAASDEWRVGNVNDRHVVPGEESGEVLITDAQGVVQSQGTFKWPADAFASRNVMLGKVFALQDDPFPGTRHDWAWLLGAVTMERATWTKRHGMSARLPNDEFLEFLIPSVKGVPVGAFLVLITLFTIVIGPLNYMYLSRKGRLYLLVVTIPVTALATSLALFGYSAVAHGFSTRARVRSLTLLDQRANTAVTTSRLSLYSGMAPSGGLRFSTDTVVFPVWPPEEGFDSGVIDWSEQQRLESGWLHSRTRTQFLTVSHRDQRGRLEVTRNGLEVSVANGLEWEIAALIVRDGTGPIAFGTDIPAGAKAKLQPITPDQRRQFANMLQEHAPGRPEYLAEYGGGSSFFSGGSYGADVPCEFSESLMERNLQALGGIKSPDYAMADASYVAILAEKPDVEIGVDGAREEAGVHVVVGHW